ncbi:VOC family protein [Streptomyces marincola]|uniref:Glyoxalase n=1 Tax=Streptomyces marincola TaxID=2878388 RepID=A0A1W7CZK9_9ACTN|nr:glyoxalase [Streptomyces marincola]ARQ70212.1 glyoxalase [Streptomyces marincola]
MTILKTYARLWSDDMDLALAPLRELTGAEPDLRMPFESVELAAIGDFLVIAGPAAARDRYRGATATVVVDDLDRTAALLAAHGARVTVPPARSATGRFLYARHADGAEVEYVQWLPELVERVIGPGARATRPTGA